MPGEAMLKIRHWLLLYLPARPRAWLYRIPFYLLALFIVPVLSIAALGAYVGPDQSAGGFAVVFLIILLAAFARSRALRADSTFDGATSAAVGQKLSDQWPFPLEPPPPRHPVFGTLLILAGLVITVVGFFCAGLVANGLLWPVLITSGVVELEAEIDPPLSVVVGLAILAVVIGAPMSFFGFAFGPRLRDFGRRLSARDARFLPQRKGERPVLLLRSFDDETLWDPRPVSLVQPRYEENLARALRQLGPVITVGRPGEDLGFAGAARLYVSDAHWRKAIRYLVAHSAAVVIIVGRTEGLWWEIEASLSMAPRERLLLFFPAVTKTAERQSWWGSFRDFVARWNLTKKQYRKMEAERLERYELFRRRCRQLVEIELPESLGHSYFLDFLANGEARVLKSKRGLLQNFMVDLIPRFRRLRFSMARTLWPFIAKLYEANRVRC